MTADTALKTSSGPGQNNAGGNEGGASRPRETVTVSREAMRLMDKLPKMRKRILLAMMDKRTIGFSQKKLADFVGCNVATVGRCEIDERFLAARDAMVRRAISVNLPSIVNSSIDSAYLKGKDGFQDRRMLMEVAKVYEPSMHNKHSGKITHEAEIGERLAQAIFRTAAHRERLADAEDPDRADDAAPPVIDVTPTVTPTVKEMVTLPVTLPERRLDVEPIDAADLNYEPV